jgi:membrane-associated phospholipid phosphatase
MAADRDKLDPTVAAASRAGWRAWLVGLARHGQQQLARLGVALTLGFFGGICALYFFATVAGGFLGGICALYFFATVAGDVVDQDTQALDTAVLLRLRGVASPSLDLAAAVASALGSEVVAVLLVLLLLIFGWQRRWGTAVALLLTTAGAQMLNNVLKDLFQRTRPAPVVGLIPAQSFSFPSGHAMVSMAFYSFLAYLSWRILRGWLRWVVTVAFLVLVLLIGLSRLYLGVHYLTDVVAGYIAGLFWTDAVIIGGALLARRRRPGRR